MAKPSCPCRPRRGTRSNSGPSEFPDKRRRGGHIFVVFVWLFCFWGRGGHICACACSVAFSCTYYLTCLAAYKCRVALSTPSRVLPRALFSRVCPALRGFGPPGIPDSRVGITASPNEVSEQISTAARISSVIRQAIARAVASVPLQVCHGGGRFKHVHSEGFATWCAIRAPPEETPWYACGLWWYTCNHPNVDIGTDPIRFCKTMRARVPLSTLRTLGTQGPGWGSTRYFSDGRLHPIHKVRIWQFGASTEADSCFGGANFRPYQGETPILSTQDSQRGGFFLRERGTYRYGYEYEYGYR